MGIWIRRDRINKGFLNIFLIWKEVRTFNQWRTPTWVLSMMMQGCYVYFKDFDWFFK